MHAIFAGQHRNAAKPRFFAGCRDVRLEHPGNAGKNRTGSALKTRKSGRFQVGINPAGNLASFRRSGLRR